MRFLLIAITLSNFIVNYSTLAKNYYVSPNGNDNNPGTLEKPWKTLKKANLSVMPGDTLFIRAGIYEETIQPLNNGQKNKLIVFINYKNEKVKITNVPIGVDLTNRSYIVINGINIINVKSRFVVIDNGHHNIITNCFMDRANSGWGSLKIVNGSYNKILFNTLKRGYGDVIYIKQSSHHNLVEGNDVDGRNSTHSSFNLHGLTKEAHHNIIRNNRFHNGDRENVNFIEKVSRNVFEGNICYNTDGNDLQLTGAFNNIIRNNIIYLSNSTGLQLWSEIYKTRHNPVMGNKIYNNIIWNNNGKTLGWHGGLTVVSFQEELSNNEFVNNILMNNSPVLLLVINGKEPNYLHGNIFRNNLFYDNNNNYLIKVGDKNIKSLTQVTEVMSFNTIFKNNIEGNPEFKDISNLNFEINPTSPAIDHGDFLTYTISEGNGTELPVKDASYFIDGFGIIEGDVIQLEGQSETRRILKVDYDNNLLILDNPLNWEKGQGVSLKYAGIAPDIGVFEYTSDIDNIAPNPPKNINIIISK